jgi:hypothetical protein
LQELQIQVEEEVVEVEVVHSHLVPLEVLVS